MKRLCKRFGAGLLVCIMLLTGACGAGINRTSPARDDMKAVWVSTVYNLDYPSKPTTNIQTLKAEADSILQGSRDMGMNAVILQVRPSCDALYPSEYFPYSKYLTGSQTEAPAGGFDVLDYWVTRAHALGLELHAWINPFRVTKGGDEEFNSLSDRSPAKQHPEWVVKDDKDYYLNPGLPEVRELVIKGAEELARNYELDGIHLDDYFYPSKTFADAETFVQYGGDFTDIGDWRRDNVNQLVRDLGKRLHNIDPSLSYGISPAGVWANKSSLAEGSETNGNETYFSAYADSRKWVQEGWIDYICPQIYWYIGHKAANYETLANWWAQTVRGTGVRLYIGMADYQADNADANSPWYGVTAIEQQLRLNRTIPEVAGEVHFRYKLMANSQALKGLYQKWYVEGDTTPDKPVEPETPSMERPLLNTTQNVAYIQGNDGNFRPTDKLSRAEAVTMLARLSVNKGGQALFDGSTASADFKDVEKGQWYASAVGFAQRYNVVGGYEDGTFRPGRSVTRAELVKIITSYFDVTEQGGSAFSDVKGHWAASVIAYAANQGWIGGYEDGTFRPDQAVTRAEAVRIINAALDRRADQGKVEQLGAKSPFADVDPTYWAYGDILEASGNLK